MAARLHSRKNRFSRQISDYRLGKILGKGSYGTVFLSYHIPTNERVAIKRLNKRRLKETKQLKRVEFEIDIQLCLSYGVPYDSRENNQILRGSIQNGTYKSLRKPHSGIVKLLQWFDDREYIYMILQLCTGGTLLDFIHNKNSVIPDWAAREYFKSLVEIIRYMHDCHIIHRDLKLANIMLDHNLRIKLGDFGLAVSVADGNDRRTLCGTPNYIAPEVASKHGHGFGADVWSLGIILYTLIARTPPFETGQVKATLAKLQKENVIYDKQIFGDLLCDLIDKMLTKDPRRRMTMDQLLKHEWVLIKTHSVAMKGNPNPVSIKGGSDARKVSNNDCQSRYENNDDTLYESKENPPIKRTNYTDIRGNPDSNNKVYRWDKYYQEAKQKFKWDLLPECTREIKGKIITICKEYARIRLCGDNKVGLRVNRDGSIRYVNDGDSRHFNNHLLMSKQSEWIAPPEAVWIKLYAYLRCCVILIGDSSPLFYVDIPNAGNTGLEKATLLASQNIDFHLNPKCGISKLQQMYSGRWVYQTDNKKSAVWNKISADVNEWVTQQSDRNWDDRMRLAQNVSTIIRRELKQTRQRQRLHKLKTFHFSYDCRTHTMTLDRGDIRDDRLPGETVRFPNATLRSNPSIVVMDPKPFPSNHSRKDANAIANKTNKAKRRKIKKEMPQLPTLNTAELEAKCFPDDDIDDIAIRDKLDTEMQPPIHNMSDSPHPQKWIYDSNDASELTGLECDENLPSIPDQSTSKHIQHTQLAAPSSSIQSLTMQMSQRRHMNNDSLNDRIPMEGHSDAMQSFRDSNRSLQTTPNGLITPQILKYRSDEEKSPSQSEALPNFGISDEQMSFNLSPLKSPLLTPLKSGFTPDCFSKDTQNKHTIDNKENLSRQLPTSSD